MSVRGRINLVNTTGPDPHHADPLRTAVEVMDRLYSPGGCPWDREQTHESLVRFLLEESRELAEAIETGDRPGMREELGDVLLQVLFHARMAAEEPEPFTVDDVAADLVAKLVRRHPHVFADPERTAGLGVGEVHDQWEAIKREEKGRASILEGIPLAQGALARAQKVVSRARCNGLSVPVGDGAAGVPDLGAELLDLVRRADAAGIDAEGALRHAIRGLETVVVAAEDARRSCVHGLPFTPTRLEH